MTVAGHQHDVIAFGGGPGGGCGGDGGGGGVGGGDGGVGGGEGGGGGIGGGAGGEGGGLTTLMRPLDPKHDTPPPAVENTFEQVVTPTTSNHLY